MPLCICIRDILLLRKNQLRMKNYYHIPIWHLIKGIILRCNTAEEILVENEFPRKIQVNDRATMLNLMRGLNGYTLCSGIISKDLNGDDYVVVPYQANVENPNSMMEIGYITRKYTDFKWDWEYVYSNNERLF